MHERHVVGAIFYTEDHKLILQDRGSNTKRFQNYISLFSGGIEKDETPLIALARELKEELDYSLDTRADYPIFTSISYELPEYQECGTYTVYLVPLDETQKITILDGVRLVRVGRDEALSLPLDKINRPIIEEYLRRNG